MAAKPKLLSLQIHACLAIIGAMSTTPTSGMEGQLKLPPDKLLVKSQLKGSNRCDCDAVVKEVTNYPLLNTQSDAILPEYSFRKPLSVAYIYILAKATYTFYTDGPNHQKS